jgi:hypothetical protein
VALKSSALLSLRAKKADHILPTTICPAPDTNNLITSNRFEIMSAEPKNEHALSPTEEPSVGRPNPDLESQTKDKVESVSAFKALGWLDRFLALWILLAMAVGIILGNFVPSTGPALQKGKFVGVSVPIGE